VQHILEKACFDCHSNNTRYPWYSNIQPVGWWLQHHVEEGKEELNFDEFRTYSTRGQAKKLHQTVGLVKKGLMPLPSYTWIHSDAKLSEEERRVLSGWADSLAKVIERTRPDNQ
jgi:hypothetical protein